MLEDTQIPKPGEIVHVRQRQYLVEEVVCNASVGTGICHWSS
jgi:hypothetical protein